MSSIAVAGSGGSSGITVNTTTITGGTDKHVLYDNAGTVGEMANFTNSGGDPNVTSGNAYLYNGVMAIEAITSLRNWYIGNAGNIGTTANDETGVGNAALATANAGSAGTGRNVCIGTNTGNAFSTATGNVCIGYIVMQTGTGLANNVGIGLGAMSSATGGQSNVAIGQSTLNACQTGGDHNTALGANALLSNTTGNGNSADGSGSLQANTTGSNNFGMGFQSLTANIDGGNNVGLGRQALVANDHGNANVGIGTFALSSLVGNSNGNVSIGASSGGSLASGGDVDNTFIGHLAGNNITAGNGNVCIGANISGPVASISNQIFIGTGGGGGVVRLDFGNTNAGKWTWAASPVLPGFTVATLPTGVLGARAYVTDGDAGLAWGATAVNSGAGATKYLVWYNGTNWTVVGK